MATRRRGLRKSERLDLYMNGRKVGRLERKDTGALLFSYDPEWLDSERAMPISRRLILREEPFTGSLVRDYFDNLLPDDRRIREKVAARVQAKGTQAFDILAAVGRDCVGALQFYSEDEEPGSVKPAEGRPLTEQEVAEILRNLQVNPLGLNPEQDFRISLAGTQSKTALLKRDGKWFLPEGATPTTHILKPTIGPIPGGPDFSLAVENQWLCLRLLQAFGLESAHADIMDFEDIRVLAVERFDRTWSGEKLYRLPQEDMCQALGFSSNLKYQSDGGPGIQEIADLLNESDQRDLDRRRFLKAQLIFWLLAAIDGHAKNFSVFIRPGGFYMTPLYDVMSADPHVNPKALPKQKLKLAMAVGESHHYKIAEVLPRHWIQTAAECKFAGMQQLMHEVAHETAAVIEQVGKKLPRRFPTAVSEPIFRGALQRAKKLAAAAEA